MNIKELQELLDSTIKTIADNGCFIENNKVIENKEVYVVSVNGIFYDEYMGDSDWRYREVSGDVIITEEQAMILINQIVEYSNVEDEKLRIEASELLTSILKDYDNSFTRLYCTEYGEFHNIDKNNESIDFSEENENEWDLSFDIYKKLLKDVEEFNIVERIGCI